MTVDYPHNIVNETLHTMQVRVLVLHTVRGKEAKPQYPQVGVWYVCRYKMSTLYPYPSTPLTRNTQCYPYPYPCPSLGVQDLIRIPQDSMGFRLWLQLMCCAYLLTLSKYFK